MLVSRFLLQCSFHNFKVVKPKLQSLSQNTYGELTLQRCLLWFMVLDTHTLRSVVLRDGILLVITFLLAVLRWQRTLHGKRQEANVWLFLRGLYKVTKFQQCELYCNDLTWFPMTSSQKFTIGLSSGCLSAICLSAHCLLNNLKNFIFNIAHIVEGVHVHVDFWLGYSGTKVGGWDKCFSCLFASLLCPQRRGGGGHSTLSNSISHLMMP